MYWRRLHSNVTWHVGHSVPYYLVHRVHCENKIKRIQVAIRRHTVHMYTNTSFILKKKFKYSQSKQFNSYVTFHYSVLFFPLHTYFMWLFKLLLIVNLPSQTWHLKCRKRKKMFISCYPYFLNWGSRIRLEFGRFVQKMIRTHATSFLAKIGS